MRTFYGFLGDFLRQPPDWVDRSSPWIIGVLGTGILALLAYAVVSAWW
jgi:hypothetical protein